LPEQGDLSPQPPRGGALRPSAAVDVPHSLARETTVIAAADEHAFGTCIKARQFAADIRALTDEMQTCRIARTLHLAPCRYQHGTAGLAISTLNEGIRAPIRHLGPGAEIEP